MANLTFVFNLSLFRMTLTKLEPLFMSLLLQRNSKLGKKVSSCSQNIRSLSRVVFKYIEILCTFLYIEAAAKHSFLLELWESSNVFFLVFFD